MTWILVSRLGFGWQQWVYVWVSTATVGLALGFNGASGGFCFGSSFGPVGHVPCIKLESHTPSKT